MMRLANGIVLVKDTTLRELKFSVLRWEVRLSGYLKWASIGDTSLRVLILSH